VWDETSSPVSVIAKISSLPEYNPDADFTSNQLWGSMFSFTDQSSDVDTWQWNFGDGNSSTEQNPSHEYMSSGTFTVTLIASFESCADTHSLQVASTVGIEDQDQENYFSIYPNPFTSEAVVTWNNSKATKSFEMQVYDLTGKQVYKLPLHTSGQKIDRNGLSAGVYFCRITSTDGTIFFGKMMVQ
jgi:PKD repeat protein